MEEQQSAKKFRKKKYNADFFLHDSNAGDDPKIRALISKMGITGYGMLFMLYEKLASSDYFEISISEDYEKENLVSMLFTSEEQFDIFLNHCFRFKLLSLEDGRLFSTGLKKRLSPILERRLKDNVRKNSQSQEDEINPQGITENSNNSTRINTDKIKNKSKIKEKKIDNMGVCDPPATVPSLSSDSSKNKYPEQLFEIFSKQYLLIKGCEFHSSSRKQDQAHLLKAAQCVVIEAERSKQRKLDTSEALTTFEWFVQQALQITPKEDNYLHANIAPRFLDTQFNSIFLKITNRYKNERSSNQSSGQPSDSELFQSLNGTPTGSH